MLNTNLLPVQEKKLIRLEEIRRIIRFFALFEIAILIIGSVFLTPTYFPLFFERRELENTLLFTQQASKDLRVTETISQAGQLKAQINSLAVLLQNSQKTSLLLEKIFFDNGDVNLNNMNIKNNTVSLSGFARTRNDLLGFEKKIRNADIFEEVSFPLSNIIKEINITFTVQGKLKPKYSL